MPRLLGTDWQKFGHTVLSAKDLGELRGYGSERGDGWVLYEALPGLYHYDPRRLAPEVVARALGGDGEEDAP